MLQFAPSGLSEVGHVICPFVEKISECEIETQKTGYKELPFTGTQGKMMQSLGLLSGQVKVDMATHSPLSHAEVVHASMVQFWKLSMVPLHCPLGEQ